MDEAAREKLGAEVTDRRDKLIDELMTLTAPRALEEARIAGIRAELEHLERYRDVSDVGDAEDWIPATPPHG